MLDLIAGARPNFMKLAPVVRALRNRCLEFRIVHTGQHYDGGMSESFFESLDIPAPDLHLNVGSGSHGAQTARILERYERHLIERRPSATVVFGDVNSTVGCALAAVKLLVPVVHVEAGLRSFDRTMPEEINRLLTDAIAELLLVSESSGVENLAREGVSDSKVQLVGNVMIDTLLAELGAARRLDMPSRFGHGLHGYGLVTLHRPSNVDRPEILSRLVELLVDLSRQLPLVFPVHPRTRAALSRSHLDELLDAAPSVETVPPFTYHENLGLMAGARLVLTDSGGMQEETTALHVPCLTLRENTERPSTLMLGTSRLVGNDPARIRAAFNDVLAGRWSEGQDVPLWDGHAGDRVAAVLQSWSPTGRASEPT